MHCACAHGGRRDCLPCANSQQQTYPYDPGTLPCSADQFIRGKVCLVFNLLRKQVSSLSRSGSKCFVCRQLIDRACTYVCIHAILFNASKDTSLAELVSQRSCGSVSRLYRRNKPGLLTLSKETANCMTFTPSAVEPFTELQIWSAQNCIHAILSFIQITAIDLHSDLQNSTTAGTKLLNVEIACDAIRDNLTAQCLWL